MGQVLAGVCDRAQGKSQVRRICNNTFDQCAQKDKGLALDNLYVATLMVYNSVNKQFLSPHKEPPSMANVVNISKDLQFQGKQAIDREEFYQLITKWIEKDMRIVLINRVLFAMLASPLMAVQTKNIGRRLPRVGEAVEKIPTPLIATIYSAGIILLQDIRSS